VKNPVKKPRRHDAVHSSTVHRNLRTGTPLWLARHRRPPLHHGSLRHRIEPDIVVVGAGISGALICDALISAGHRVVVFDRRGPLLGSTPASTALLQFEIDTPLVKLAKMIGREKAMRAWWRSVEGVNDLRARVMDLGIDCDFAERSSLYLPGTELDVDGLRAEAAIRRAAGLRSSLIDRAALRRLSGIDRPGAIYSHGAAEANPVKLTAGIWRANIARGARLYAPVDVMDVVSFKQHVRLKLRSGAGGAVRDVTARAVVFATGYETLKFVHPKGYRVSSTWAYATRPQPARLWAERALIWEASDPYLYIRTDKAGHVLVGGEDEDFSDAGRRDAALPDKIAAIERKLRRLMPRLDASPLYAWTGSFGASRTGLPLIGEVPGHSNCYAALGFGGNGITFSAIAARMLQRRLDGVADPDADLFAF
jgi:glycine/D-amino acid oxidase-like deaminating enzyme